MTRLRLSAMSNTVIAFQHLAQIKVDDYLHLLIRTSTLFEFLSAPAHTFSTLKNPLIYFEFFGGISPPSSTT